MSNYPVPRKRSWPQAFGAWLKNPEASGVLKFFFFGGSVTVLDEWIPFIGQLDDPMIPVWAIIVGFSVYKINKHRDPLYGLSTEQPPQNTYGYPQPDYPDIIQGQIEPNPKLKKRGRSSSEAPTYPSQPQQPGGYQQYPQQPPYDQDPWQNHR